MPSSIVGVLKVLLTADAAEYTSVMADASKQAAAFSKEFTSIGRQMTAVGQALTKTITLPILGLGASVLKVTSDFESSFAGVRKTVEATEPEFAALAQGLRDMAKEIPVNVDELNKVAESAGQLGIKKDDIHQFTRTMADLGVTTNLTADEAATATAKFQNIFGAAGKDVDRFGATLVALGNAGASTEKDIIDMGLRIAGAGHQIGMSQHQVMAFASTLSSVGINAEAGGTTISRVFLKMNDAVSKGGKDLAEFARVSGMTAAQFKETWERDAAQGVLAFINGLGRLKESGDNVNMTIEGLMGKSILIKDTLMRTSGAGALLAEQLDLSAKAWEKNSALTDEATKRYQTFHSQLQVFWNQVRDVGIELGTALLPAMKNLVSIAQQAIPIIDGMVKAFTGMPTWVQASVVAFAGFAAAAGPVLWVMGQIVTSIGTVIGAFKAKGIATKALDLIMESSIMTSGRLAGALRLLGPAAAVAATAFASWNIGKWIGEWTGLTNVIGYLSAKLGELLGLLPKGAAAQYVASLRAQEAAAAAKKQAEEIEGASAATRQLSDASRQVAPNLDRAASSIAAVGEDAKEAEKRAKAFAESLRALGGADAIAGAREVVKQLGALGGPLNVLPSKLGDMAARLREGAQAALLMGQSGLANQYSKLADTLDPIIQFQQRYNVTIGEYVTDANMAANATDALWEQIHRLTGQVQTIAPVLTNSLKLPWVQFAQAVQAESPKAQRGIENIAEAFRNLGPTILSAVQGGGSVLASIGSSFGQAIGKDLQESLSGFLTRNLGKTIGDALGAVLPGIGALLGPALSAIGSGFKKIFGIGINEEVHKANIEIGKLRDELLRTHGPLEVLEQKAQAVGLSFAQNWAHQGQAGLAAFQGLINEFNSRWSELQAKREELEGQLGDLRGEFDGLVGKARDLGYEFNQSGEFVGVTFDAVKAKADEFGVSIDGLGPKFRQQQMDAEASKLINAFTLLEKAGGDVGGILVGMKDEISTVVQNSIKFGTTIPANMKPWIQNLFDTHQLLDENGDAITDISELKFSEPIETQFQSIANALKEVIQKIDDLITRIASIPTNKTVTVTTVHEDVYTGGESGSPNTQQPEYAVGTMGVHGAWFRNFGDVTKAALHGFEAVITPQQAVPFAYDVLDGLGGGMTPAIAGNAGNGQVVEAISRLERTLITTIPALSETAARHGAQTAGRRR